MKYNAIKKPGILDHVVDFKAFYMQQIMVKYKVGLKSHPLQLRVASMNRTKCDTRGEQMTIVYNSRPLKSTVSDVSAEMWAEMDPPDMYMYIFVCSSTPGK